MFELDPRLQNDCQILTKLNNCQVLLLNNKSVPWLIIVPEVNQTELHELHPEMQSQIYETINIISKFITLGFNPNKLNIAALGNVVSQLHIHIIGRYHTDEAWPNPVWGNLKNNPYKDAEVEKIRIQLLDHLKIYK